jgi:hypothetical protein
MRLMLAPDLRCGKCRSTGPDFLLESDFEDITRVGDAVVVGNT